MAIATRYLDRVVVTVASAPGTGAITPGPAVASYQSFASAGAINAAVYPYDLVDGNDFEYGFGTYLTAGPAFQRTTILGSSNAGAAINASAAAILTATLLAEDFAKLLAMSVDGAANVTLAAGLAVPGTVSGAGFSAYLASPPDIGQTAAGMVGIKGITSGAAVAAGRVGERLFGQRLSGSAIALTTNVSANIVTLNLSAGLWLVWGSVGTIPSSTIARVRASIGTTSATLSDPASGEQLRRRLFRNHGRRRGELRSFLQHRQHCVRDECVSRRHRRFCGYVECFWAGHRLASGMNRARHLSDWRGAARRGNRVREPPAAGLRQWRQPPALDRRVYLWHRGAPGPARFRASSTSDKLLLRKYRAADYYGFRRAARKDRRSDFNRSAPGFYP